MFKAFWLWEDDNFNELEEELELDENIEKEKWQLALDIVETPYEVIIVAPIAWIDLEDIDLSLNKSVLTIKGTREQPEEIYSDTEVKLRNSECFWWDFVRNVILPENLDFDSIKASMENNLLIVSITKLKFTSQNIKIDRIEG